MEQKDLKPTELDKMTCSYDLQMLKAALTYFPPQPKRLLSVLIKIQELKNTLCLISSTESAGYLNICSTPESTPKQGFFDIWNEIREYGSPEQQKMFDKINQAIKLAGMYEQMTQAASGTPEQPDSDTSRTAPQTGMPVQAEDPLSSDIEEESASGLAAASLENTVSPPSKDQRRPDFRTYIRNSLSQEDQVLFDSYSAMFHSLDIHSGKET